VEFIRGKSWCYTINRKYKGLKVVQLYLVNNGVKKMRMYLLDNGIDSLKMGVDFFNKYLKKDTKGDIGTESYLKLALICIHNAVEILGKETLSRVNDLIIYKDLTNPLLEAVKLRHKNNVKVPLYNIIINQDLNVKTIAYSECLNRLKVLFGLTEESVNHLIELGEMRNKVTHFGIQKEIDFYEVIGIINFALDFTIEFFYPVYKIVTPHPLDVLYNKLIDVLEEGQLAEDNYWGAIYADNFVELNELFKQASIELKINQVNHHESYKLEFENDGFDDSRFFIIDVLDNEGYLSTLGTLNIPVWGVTVLYNIDSEEGNIYAVYDHNDGRLFLKTQSLNIKAFTEKANMSPKKTDWKKIFGKKFKQAPLTLESVEIMLSQFLRDLEIDTL